MCGFNALQYVRFRHVDNDLVRAARQQDFLREARQKLPPREADRATATSCSTSSPSTRPRTSATPSQLLELLKTFVARRRRAGAARSTSRPSSATHGYVTATDEAIQAGGATSSSTARARPASARPASTAGRRGVESDGGEDEAAAKPTATTTKPDEDSRTDFVGPPMDDSTERARRTRSRSSASARTTATRWSTSRSTTRPGSRPARPSPRDTPRVRDRRPRQGRLHGYKMVVDVPATPSATACTEYYGVSGTDWVDAADPRQPERDADDRRPGLPALLRRRPAAPGRLEDRQGRLLGQQHPAAVARRGPDALDRDLDARVRRQVASARIVRREREAADRRHRGGLGRSGHRRLLRRARPSGGRDGHRRRRRSRRCAPAARCRSTSPGCRSWSSEIASGSRSRPRWPRCSAPPGCCSAASTPRRPTPATPTSRGSRRWSRALPDGGEHALVMKSTVPAGHRRRDPRAKPDLVYVSCPEFLKEGSAVDDFLAPRPGRDRRRPRLGVGRRRGRGAYEPLGGEIVRTDVASAEMIKLASNAFLATKISFINEIANVCEGVGADVTEVARGMGLDERIGPQFLQAGIGYGGSCFPKDVSALKQLAGNTGYHFQLLNSVIEVNELQKRRVISKLDQAPRLAGRQAGGAARARVQAEHRRHARGVEPGALGAAAGRGRDRASPTTRSPRAPAARCCRASSSATRPRRRSTAPTPRSWSPSGRSSPSSTGRSWLAGCRTR